MLGQAYFSISLLLIKYLKSRVEALVTLVFAIYLHMHLDDAAIQNAAISSHYRKEANAIWGSARQNAAYLAAICDFKLRLSATTVGRGAIWEIE